MSETVVRNSKSMPSLIKIPASFLSMVLIVLMLILPAKLYLVKIAILLLLFMILLFYIDISKPVRFLCAALCTSTIWGITIGVLKDTASPLYTLTIGLMWPLLSLIIVLPLLKTKSDYNNLLKVLFLIHFFIVVYDILFALSSIYGFPFINLYPEVENPFKLYNTTSRLNLDDNMNVLTYTTPLFFLLWLSKYKFGVSRIIQTLVLILNLGLLVFSGRRSVMLVFVTAPFLVLLCYRVLPKSVVKSSKYLLFSLVLLVVGVFVYLYIEEPLIFHGYIEQFTKAFDSDEEPIRFVEYKILMEAFWENPILGTGTGQLFWDPVRTMHSDHLELTYLLRLANGGIIGFFFYVIGIIGPCCVLFYYGQRKKDILAVFMSFAFLYILIADATNPILSSFDLMVPLYLAYAKINALALNYPANNI